MNRVQNLGQPKVGQPKTAYYHCTRCCKEATPSCLRHKQQIEIFYGSEIEKLDRRRQYQCNFCSKIGYSSSATITCWFCNSRDIKLIWFFSSSFLENSDHLAHFDQQWKIYFIAGWSHPFNNRNTKFGTHFQKLNQVRHELTSAHVIILHSAEVISAPHSLVPNIDGPLSQLNHQSLFGWASQNSRLACHVSRIAMARLDRNCYCMHFSITVPVLTTNKKLLTKFTQCRSADTWRYELITSGGPPNDRKMKLKYWKCWLWRQDLAARS